MRANEKNPLYDSYPPPCHPSSLRKMSPTAPSRRTNPAEEAATKAMRSEVRALLKLKRTPFEDKLMKLFTRDELVSLYRRSVGLQKDVPNDAVARQTKQWSKRTLAGKIHGLVKARTFGMLDGIVVAVAAILVWVGGLWCMRGEGRTINTAGDNVGNGRGGGSRGVTDCEGAVSLGGTSRSPMFGAVAETQQERAVDMDEERCGAVVAETQQQATPTLSSSTSGRATQRMRSPRRSGICDDSPTSPGVLVPKPNIQRIIIATLCAVIAGGGWAGIAHGINVSARTRFRNRFAKHLRTLRAKRPSATSRRLTRFVKRFGRTK